MGLSSPFPYSAGMLYLQKCPDKIRLRDYLPVYKEPLPDIHKMRGHECPAGNFCFPDHGGEECTDGTLSVGSRHMDHLKFPVRFSKKTKKFPYF